MNYYDIALFEVEKGLQKRLGYDKIYSIGKDISIQPTPKHSSIPIIIKSGDPGQMIRFLRESEVVGIIFEGNVLSKKTIEKAAEANKTIFVPVSMLLWQDVWGRQAELRKIKQIFAAAHKLKAKAAIATFAENAESLLSKDQMSELAEMIFNTKNSKFKIFGGELYDN